MIKVKWQQQRIVEIEVEVICNDITSHVMIVNVHFKKGKLTKLS